MSQRILIEADKPVDISSDGYEVNRHLTGSYEYYLVHLVPGTRYWRYHDSTAKLFGRIDQRRIPVDRQSCYLSHILDKFVGKK